MLGKSLKGVEAGCQTWRIIGGTALKLTLTVSCRFYSFPDCFQVTSAR